MSESFKYSSRPKGQRLYEARPWMIVEDRSIDRWKGGGVHVTTSCYEVSLQFPETKNAGPHLGFVFQTEECGKQWLAIDRDGRFWGSYGKTRDDAAAWLMRRYEPCRL